MFLSPWSRKPIRRDPFWTVESDFDNLWKALETTPFSALENLRESTIAPRIDVIETEKAIEVKADMPGMAEKDIQVSVDKNVLTIRGERHEEFEDKKDAKFHRIERHSGEYVRQLTLPESVDVNKIDAQFANGVLKVLLPKKAAEVESRKTIEVKKG